MSACQKIATVTFSVEMHDSHVGGLHILRYFSDIVVAVRRSESKSRFAVEIRSKEACPALHHVLHSAQNISLLAVGTRIGLSCSSRGIANSWNQRISRVK